MLFCYFESMNNHPNKFPGLLEKPVAAGVDSPATTKAKRLYESCVNEGLFILAEKEQNRRISRMINPMQN